MSYQTEKAKFSQIFECRRFLSTAVPILKQIGNYVCIEIFLSSSNFPNVRFFRIGFEYLLLILK